jgi:uncharacterized protein involved in copper resistance
MKGSMMKKLTLTLAAFALLGTGSAFAHDPKPGDTPKHEMKMKDGMKHGKMECCMTDADGKKTCKTMDHSKMHDGKMHHGQMDHGKMKHKKSGDQ